MPLVTQEQRWRIHVTSFYDYISDQHRDWFILTSAVALTGRAGGDGISPAAGPRPGEAPDLLRRPSRAAACIPSLCVPSKKGGNRLREAAAAHRPRHDWSCLMTGDASAP